MSHARLRNLKKTLVDVPNDAIERLRTELEGDSLAPGDPKYDDTRRIWNAMIDRRPGLIAQCRNPRDVQRCVHFAQEHGVALTVRGGGHNIGGRALADGALLVDFSPRRGVRVDAETCTVQVEPGATLGDLDAATVAHALVVPSGIVSETGLAGLTLGGGFGWLSRRFGLTCDHLTGVEIVAGTGEIISATDQTHPDLMWALRGGGGGCGIVTSFHFRAQTLAPTVTAGPMFRADNERLDAFRRFVACTADSPEQLGCMLKLGAAPPAPFLDASLHGRPSAVTIVCHTGDASRTDADLAPLRAGVQPAADMIEPRRFPQFQSMFDAGEPKGRRDYWKSEYVENLDEEIGTILLEATERLPSPPANIKVFHLGGAVTRVPADATAAGHRDARYIVVIGSAWDDPADDEANIAWVRDTYRRVHDRSQRGGYINFLTEDTTTDEMVAARAGVDVQRLAEIRKRFDPAGLFTL